MKVLILGGTSDLGLSIARKYAEKGWQVQLTARDISKLKAIQTDLQIRYEVAVSIHKLDARAFDTHTDFLRQVMIEETDVVVYVIGYMAEQTEAQSDFEKSRNMVESNYLGAVSLLNQVADIFEKRASGTIIGISSVAGDRGRKSNYIYGSSKAALSSYLDGMRHRLADKGVHVMTVKPGFMETKMTEGLDLPGPLTANPDRAAKIIVNAALKRKNKIYVLGIWRWIMLIIRNVPEFIFKKTNL